MRCYPPLELTRFLDSRFSDEEVRALDDHLVSCPVCRETLDALTHDPAVDAWLTQRQISPAEVDSTRDGAHSVNSSTGEEEEEEGEERLLRQLRQLSRTDLLVSAARATLGGEAQADETAATDKPAVALPDIPGLNVIGPLGRGGMGIVFEAYDPHLRRRVALKMISRERAPAELMGRIRLEAQAAARLNHPHVVQIYAVGESGGQPYVVLEFVSGGTLADRIAGRPQPPRESATLLAKLARAVHFAHERQVIHRDLKPRNVLIDDHTHVDDAPLSDVIPKITDFGLAKLLDSELQHTRTDQIMGTPAYAAPEQLNAEFGAIGPATDIYALGAMLYELLTGRPPLQADDIWRTIQLVLETEPVSPRQLQPGIPRDLETICLNCLAKDPGRRYASAAALADDLDRFLADQPIFARPISLLERLQRWSRRNKALAASLAVVALLLTAAAVTSTIAAANQRRLSGKLNATVVDLTARTAELTKARNKARQDAAENLRLARAAEVARQAAEDTTYFSRIALADRAWQSADVHSTKQLLQKCLPADGHRDRRNWEWRYLNELCQSELLTIDPRNGHQFAYLFGVAFSPDGRWLVTGSTEMQPTGKSDIAVWDTHGYGFARRTEIPVSFPVGLRFRDDGRQLAVFDRDGQMPYVCRFDESPSSFVPLDQVAPGSFDPTEPILAEVDRDHEPAPTVRVRDRTTGSVLQTLTHPGGVRSTAVSHDGRRVVTVGDDLALRVWEVGVHQPTQTLHGHTYTVTGAAFHPTRHLLASVGLDLSIRIWDLTRAQRQRIVHVPPTLTNGERLVDFDFTPDGDELIGLEGGYQSPIFGRADVATGEVRELRQVPSVQIRPRGHHAVSLGMLGGRLVAPVRHHEGEVAICELATGRLLSRLADPTCPISRASISRDGRRVATTSTPRAPVLLWDADTGQILHRLSPPVEPTSASASEPPPMLAFSLQGDRLATGYNGAAGVHLWDVPSGRHVRHLTLAPEWNVSAISFSSDGRQLAVVSSSMEKIAVFDIESGRRRHVLSGPASIQSIAFSPTSPRLAGVGRQGPVYLWDSDSGELILHLARSKATRGSYGYDVRVKWSSDGRRLAANNWTGSIDVWDAPDHRRNIADRLAVAETRSTLWLIQQAQTISDRSLAVRYARLIGDHALTTPHTRIQRGFMWARFEEWELATNDLLPADDSTRGLLWLIARRGDELPGLLPQLVKLRPDVAELHYALARSADRQGDAEVARRHHEQAVTLLERNFHAHPDDQALARQLAESLLARRLSTWRRLQPVRATSAFGATLTVQPDASIVASGTDLPGDTYAITAPFEGSRVAALRLEALPAPNLPNYGPGRHPSGNFQLAAIRVRRVSDADGAEPQAIPLRTAWASYTWPAPNVDVRGTIDEARRQVWHVWSRFGEPHYAVFAFEQPIDLESDERLIVELRHFAELPVNLGRFRLSACEIPNAIQCEWDLQLLQDADVNGFTALAAARLAVGDADRAWELLQRTTETFSPVETSLRLLLTARILRQRGQIDAAQIDAAQIDAAQIAPQGIAMINCWNGSKYSPCPRHTRN